MHVGVEKRLLPFTGISAHENSARVLGAHTENLYARRFAAQVDVRNAPIDLGPGGDVGLAWNEGL